MWYVDFMPPETRAKVESGYVMCTRYRSLANIHLLNPLFADGEDITKYTAFKRYMQLFRKQKLDRPTEINRLNGIAAETLTRFNNLRELVQTRNNAIAARATTAPN